MFSKDCTYSSLDQQSFQIRAFLILKIQKPKWENITKGHILSICPYFTSFREQNIHRKKLENHLSVCVLAGP